VRKEPPHPGGFFVAHLLTATRTALHDAGNNPGETRNARQDRARRTFRH
jgi:hypothetical protein